MLLPFDAVNADGDGAATEGLEIQAGTALVIIDAVGQGGADTPVGYLTINSGTVALNGAITAAANGDISITTTNTAGDIVVNNDIDTSGTGKIDLTSARHVTIASTAAATVTAVDGDVTVTGVDVTMGTEYADVALTDDYYDGRIVTSTGSGNVKIDNTGAFLITAGDADSDTVDSGIDSGGHIDIDPTTVTINGDGVNNNALEADDYITIIATGAFTNNDIITTTDVDSYITITAASIAQEGDITTPTGSNEYVTLTATTTITDTTDDTTDITTETLNITGATTVGGSALNAELDTDVTYLDVSNASGAVVVSEFDGITVTGAGNEAAFTLTNLDNNIVVGVAGLTADGTITLTADDDLTVNGVVTSTDGAVDLDATNGSMYVNANVVGNDVAMDANTNITVSEDLDNTQGGYHMQAGALVTIDADVGVPGASTLTLIAGTDLIIADTASATVSSVDGLVTLTGNNVILGTDTGDGVGVDDYVDGRVVTSGGGNVDINATVSFTIAAGNQGAGDTGDTVDSGIDAGGWIDIDPDTVTINGAGLLAVGDITVDAVDQIDVNAKVESTTGKVDLTVTQADVHAVAGTINIAANVIGDDVTITASDTTAGTAVINVTSVLNNNRGGYTFEADDGTLDIDSNITAQDFIALNGGAAIQLAANLTATDNNITVNDALTVDGDSVVTATSGDVTFSGTVGGAQSLTVNSVSGTTTFGSTVGAVTGELTALTVSAATANIGGNISTDVAGGANVDFTGTEAVVLTANVTIDTDDSSNGGDAGDILFNTTGTIDGDVAGRNLTLNAHVDGDVAGDQNAGDVQLGTVGQSFALGTLIVNTTEADADAGVTGDLDLYGNIRANTQVDFSNAPDVDIYADVEIDNADDDADGVIVLLTGGDVAGDHDLAVDSGAGAVTLGLTAGETDIDVNKLTVTSTGTTSIAGDIETDEGMDFGNATDVDIVAGITLTNTDSGTVDLSGMDVAAAGNLDIAAGATDVKIGTTIVGAAGELDVDSTGTTTIVGNITTAGGNVAFDGATNVVLNPAAGNLITISTGAGAGNIDFVAGGGTNALSGGFDLDLIAGTGNVYLDNITQLTDLTVSSSGTTQFAGITDMAGDINVAAATLIDVDDSTTTTGPITLDSAGNIDIDGAITASGAIDIDADTNITVDANITGDGSNTITLTADSETNGTGNLVIAGTGNATITTAGDITIEGEDITVGVGGSVGKVITTGAGKVTIKADNEDDATDGSFQIATAGSIISSSTTIVTNAFEVTIGGTGMSASDDITISGVNDDINIGALVTSSDEGDIIMTAGSDVLFDAAAGDIVTGGTGNVTITATAGSILETVDDTAVDIQGYQITLSANGDIGEDLGPDGTLDAALEIDSRDWIKATTVNNDIWLLETEGAMYLNEITTGSNAAGIVTLQAIDSSGTQITNGAIKDALIAAVQVTAGSLRLDAERGIGVLDTPLNTNVGILAAQTDDYGIYIQNTSALIIGTVNGRVGVVILDNGDDIWITSTGSSITVSDVVTNNDGGYILLAAEGTTDTDDLTINAAITAAGGNGNIYLYAGDTIAQNSVAVTAAGSGTIKYYAGVDYNNGTPQAGVASGAITMNATATAVSTSGNITMTAPGDVTIGAITTAGDVSITADDNTYSLADNAGAISEAAAEGTANIVAVTAMLRAATGVGSADDIETKITTLDVLNSTSGNIQVYELAAGTDLNVNQATQSAAGNLLVQTENGTLTVVADQSGVATTTGTLTLIAGDSDTNYAEDLVINDTVTSTTGNITLTSSGDDVTFGAGGDVTSTSGNVDVNAESGAGLGEGIITMADGALIDSGTGQIDIDAYGDITLGGLSTTYTADDAVAVTSVAGGIIDGGDTHVDIIANTAFATADLDAATGIGSVNALETAIYNLEVKNTTSGNIKIAVIDAINLPEVINQAATGSVDVTAAGTITTTTVTSGGAVNLYATAGNIFDTAGGLITAGAESSLKASGIIGTAVTPSYNPVDVNIDGDLWVWAGSERDQVSVILEGYVNSSAETERVKIYEPSPPGLVMLDNSLMGGGNYGSILSRGYGETLIVITDMFSLFYDRAVTPWGHKISTSWLPFEGYIIDDDFLNCPIGFIDISQLDLKALPPEFFINPEKAQSVHYYIIRKK